MEGMFVTVSYFAQFHQKEPFVIGRLLACVKDPSNPHDSEAIKVVLPNYGTLGYIVNNPKHMAGGTVSAARIYDKFEDPFYVRVLFTTQSKIICKIENEDIEAVEDEFKAQNSDIEERLIKR